MAAFVAKKQHVASLVAAEKQSDTQTETMEPSEDTVMATETCPEDTPSVLDESILNPLVAILVQESHLELESLLKHVTRILCPPTFEEAKDPYLETIKAWLTDAIPRLASFCNYGAVNGDDNPKHLAIWRWEVNQLQGLIPADLSQLLLERRHKRIAVQEGIKSILQFLQEEDLQDLFTPPVRVSRRKASASTPGSAEMLRLKEEEKAKKEKERLKKEQDRLKREEERLKKEQVRLEEKQRKEEEKLRKEEEKRRKGEERLLEKQRKEQQRLLEIQAKEEEAKRKEEERNLKKLEKEKKEAEKKQAEEEKKRKEMSQQRTLNGFFSVEKKPPRDEPSSQSSQSGEPEHEQYFKYFLPFSVKRDMTVAPTNRFWKEIDSDKFLDPAPMETCLAEFKQICHSSRRIKVLATPILPKNIVVLDFDGWQETQLVKPWKLLQFAENVRPAYFGTFSKQSTTISGRTPLLKDMSKLDYDFDSEAEWEEDEPGEELGSDDDDSEEEEAPNNEAGADEDDDDGWLVPHGYLSEDEGEDVVNIPTDKKANTATVEAPKRKKLEPLVPVIKGPFFLTPENATSSLAESLSSLSVEIVKSLQLLFAKEISEATSCNDVMSVDVGSIEVMTVDPLAIVQARQNGDGNPVDICIQEEIISSKGSMSTPTKSHRKTPKSASKSASKSVFPSEYVDELLELVKGKEDSLQKLVGDFKLKHPELTKVSIEAAIRSVAVREKRVYDKRPKWYQLDSHGSVAATNATEVSGTDSPMKEQESSPIVKDVNVMTPASKRLKTMNPEERVSEKEDASQSRNAMVDLTNTVPPSTHVKAEASGEAISQGDEKSSNECGGTLYQLLEELNSDTINEKRCLELMWKPECISASKDTMPLELVERLIFVLAARFVDGELASKCLRIIGSYVISFEASAKALSTASYGSGDVAMDSTADDGKRKTVQVESEWFDALFRINDGSESLIAKAIDPYIIAGTENKEDSSSSAANANCNITKNAMRLLATILEAKHSGSKDMRDAFVEFVRHHWGQEVASVLNMDHLECCGYAVGILGEILEASQAIPVGELDAIKTGIAEFVDGNKMKSKWSSVVEHARKIIAGI